MAIKLLGSSICTAIAEPTNAAYRVHAVTDLKWTPDVGPGIAGVKV